MNVTHENATSMCEDVNQPYYRSTIGTVVDWLIVLIGLPEVCVAGYALLNLSRKKRAAPVFVVNLLLSDLLQIAATFPYLVSRFYDDALQPLVDARCILQLFLYLCMSASLGFMLLISVERYLLVAFPAWYSTRNITKLSTLASVGLWILCLTCVTLDYKFLVQTGHSLLVFSCIFLLPAPFLVGFFVVTWKALYRSTTMRREAEKRKRVLRALGLVLGIYTVLFLPFSLRNLYYYSLSVDRTTKTGNPVRDLSSVLTGALVYLSPLIDPFLYIFMRRDVRHWTGVSPSHEKTPMKACARQRGGLTKPHQGETAATDL